METTNKTKLLISRLLDEFTLARIGNAVIRMASLPHWACQIAVNDTGYHPSSPQYRPYTAYSGVKKRAKMDRIRLFLPIGAKNASGLKSTAMPRGYWASRAFG
jgi:hypothetical protein